MASFSKIGRIAKELARNPKVKGALQSPQARRTGGQVVDKAANLADRATKGKHQPKIQRARDEARKRLDGKP